jgi:hypothetical protein
MTVPTVLLEVVDKRLPFKVVGRAMGRAARKCREASPCPVLPMINRLRRLEVIHSRRIADR